MGEGSPLKVSKEFMQLAASGEGGWNKAQLALLGVSWPPQKGWMTKIIGLDVPEDVWAKVLQLRGNAGRVRQRKPQDAPGAQGELF